PGATPLGIVLSDPEHFARKWSSYLFHPEYGLEKTMPTIIIDGTRYQPNESTKVVWYPGERPTVMALWDAGGTSVIESFWTSIDQPVLVREISIQFDRTVQEVELELSLYGNPAIFSEFLGSPFGLAARGYDALLVNIPTEGIFHERTLRFPLIKDSSLYRMTVMYSLGVELPDGSIHQLVEEERGYWEDASLRWTSPHPNRLLHEVERLFTASAMGLRAAVAPSGRFDASLWQYGYEWSGDAANVVEGLVYSGQFEVAQSVLENILTRLTIPEGMAMESSRFRGGLDSELNNNGEILKACRTYLEWTGDREFIGNHWERIRAIAEYLLRPEFLHGETGMLIAARDIWERNAAVGILPGFDVAHQTFGILGLRDAARIAKEFKFEDEANRWMAAAKKMHESFFHHPTHSMIENGRIIKRRLLDGSVQRELSLEQTDTTFRKAFVPDGMPLSSGKYRLWEPDVSQIFPIVFGLVDPRSEIARTTLDDVELLWSQAWEGGGYGRYNVFSEPDSPGPWPLATMYMIAALVEAGEHEKVTPALDWLIEKAGAGGSWFEFYGDRPTPPLPPTGILVWAWAEWIALIVNHFIGARV
ncbi:MAG TPA: hypothetical protein VGM92_14520, partial [Candidatus Kapabacteria bacterium]